MAYVIGKAHVEAIRVHLDRSSLDASAEEGVAGIMRAALIGQTDAVLAFLDRGVPVNARDANGRTPLMESIFGGHIDTFEELLNRGADVNAQDFDGWTALMEASAKGRVDFVRTLLAYGADPRLRNKNGWTALRATAKCNTDVTRLLKDAVAG